ncbi:hypothetical protein [uncultured Olegusella sp.]|uniref:hypothetical protein n=1 Tax=uncultured Olegusella sp. TaxID=1979846 RepID=UPI0026383D8F|nr:hypothetical protein [uncultured Olegusella sp.]
MLAETASKNSVEVFLNTWKNYNEGGLGFGWMAPEEALDFMESHPDFKGGEYFIADIDNFSTSIPSLELCNTADTCKALAEFGELDESEKLHAAALAECEGCTLQEAIDSLDDHVFYDDVNEFYECMDELLTEELPDALHHFTYYIDWDKWHEACLMDYFTAKNGVVYC